MRWLFSNAQSRLAFAARHPSYAVRSLLRELFMADERFLAALTAVPLRQLRHVLDEPISTPFLATCLLDEQSTVGELQVGRVGLCAKRVLFQDITVRAALSDVAPETGVANGVSSAYLLLAPDKNACGRLHSLELGNPAYLPAGKPPGWIVPQPLRSRRWHLLVDGNINDPNAESSLGSTRRESPTHEELSLEVGAKIASVVRAVGFLQRIGP
jgi:hypothetical protein